MLGTYAGADEAEGAALGIAGPLRRIAARDFGIGVIGLGYVGLPLALAGTRAGFRVLGFDIDAARAAAIGAGRSTIGSVADAEVAAALASGRFEATTDAARLGEPDALLICVPTPLTRHLEPDLSHIEAAAAAIARRLRPGQLVVLESTTWPGTTEEVVKPILERTGLKSGADFHLAFSPEREDPGNREFSTGAIPKIVGGDGPAALALARALYDALVVRTVPVSSPATAEAAKLTENIFRAVNIALVNELKVIYSAMGIDVWEVIDAAKTKPFGFMPFYPGPGLGGHCIPIDPFYLTWKAREFGITTRFIELAGQINRFMPQYVVDRIAEALDASAGRGLNGASVLVLGLAYKKNIDDVRESPAIELIRLMEARRARVAYHDPHIPKAPRLAEHPWLEGRDSLALSAATVAAQDVVVIATDHEAVDYRLIAEQARLVVDTRNVMERLGLGGGNVVKA